MNVLYTSKDANPITKGMLLHYDAEQKEWGTLPYRSRVIAGEQLACPQPLDAVFSIAKTDCEVTFFGGTLARFVAPKLPSAFALNLSQGRVLFVRGDEGEDRIAFDVIVGKDVLHLELADLNTRCGLEIIPRLPDQVEQSRAPNWYEGKLWVDSGHVQVTDGLGGKQLLAAKQSLNVTPHQAPDGSVAGAQPPTVGVDPGVADQPPMVMIEQIMPDWLNPMSRSFTSLMKKYMGDIYEAFQEADAESDVTTVLLPLAKDDKTPPMVAVMAAKTLAMTGCLRDVADLLSRSESTPEDIRLATIESTRRWLALHPDKRDGQRFRDALGQHFTKEDATKIYRLLWGYRKSDLKVNTEAVKLVDYLMEDNITVRTLAFLQLKELTGQTNNYRPLDSATQRSPSVKRWRDDARSGKLFD